LDADPPAQGVKIARRNTVELLALAHERSCEADLAAALVEQMGDGGVPDLAPLRARFAPIAARLPVVAVNCPATIRVDAVALAASFGLSST
jgi:hypothetical protein